MRRKPAPIAPILALGDCAPLTPPLSRGRGSAVPESGSWPQEKERREGGGWCRRRRAPASRSRLFTASRRRGSFPSRAGSRRRVPGPPLDDAAVRGVRLRRASRTAATGTCSRRGRPASRSPSICRRRWATTRTIRLARGEVGKVGVAIATIEDMRLLTEGLPLGRRLHFDDDQLDRRDPARAPARRGAGARRRLERALAAPSRTTSSRSTSPGGRTSFRRAPSLKLTTDIFEFCGREVPRWNTISISGYHIREAGSTAVQEVAFTLSNAIAYVEAALARGLVDRRRSRRGSPSSSTRTRTSSRRSRSSGRRGPSGPRSRATASGRRTRAPGGCGSTRRRPARR